VTRLITALRGLVRSGNSGGPVVDTRGRVLTTVFAAARRSGSGSGFGVPDSIVRRALGRAGSSVSTGACAH
jgi:S1-C subfamily serine protease